MNHVAWLTVLLVSAAMAAGYWADLASDSSQVMAAAPPLSLDGLLNEKLPEAKEKVKLKVDNSACYVCHGNYEEEPLVVWHGKHETSCIDCHGKSLAHRNDEDNITPPDKMYAPDQIDEMCKGCHEEHDVAARKVITRWQKKCPAKTNPREIVCTDCHFKHRLSFRTVWWDKKTGKLIVRKEGERTKKAADLSKSDEEEKKPSEK